jgi:hypothetical protein
MHVFHDFFRLIFGHFAKNQFVFAGFELFCRIFGCMATVAACIVAELIKSYNVNIDKMQFLKRFHLCENLLTGQRG